MAEPFNFEALSLVEDIEKEQKELTKAQKDFALTVQDVGNEQLGALTRYNEDLSDLAAQQSAVHESMREDLNEADRIAGSIPLSLLSETLEKIAPQLTVKGRMQSAARKQEESNMLRQQFALETKQHEINEQKRLQKIKNAQAAMQAEQGDVTALQQKFANLRAVAQERRAATVEARASEAQSIREMEAELTTSDNPEELIGKQFGGMKVTKQMVREETLRRQAQEDAAYLSGQAKKLGDRKMELLARQREGEGMTLSELNEMSQRCESQGFAVSTGGNTFQCNEIAALLDNKAVFRDGMIEARVAMEAGKQQMDSTVKSISRIQGTPQNPQVGMEAYLDTLANDPTLDPDTRALLASANARMKEAEQLSGSFLDQSEQMAKAFKDANDALLTLQKQKLATAPDPHAAAMTEYWTNGEVDSVENAISSSVFALQTGDSTGNPIYDSGLSLLPGMATEVASSGDAVGKKVNALLVDGNAGEAYAALLATPHARQKIATQMFAFGAADLYKQASLSLGDEEFTAMMHDTTSTFYADRVTGPEFSMASMFNYLRNTDQSAKFAERVNAIIDKYTQANYSPQGKKGYISASVDKAVFNNGTQDFFKFKVREHLRTGSQPPPIPMMSLDRLPDEPVISEPLLMP